MQVIEKVKVVPEGYNGAGMNYDGGNRRDVNGKANAGLTLGIIGTALGAWALFGNRRSAGASILGGAGGGMLGDGYCWYENQPNDKYKVWNNQVNTTGTPLTLDKPTLNITSDDNYSYEYHTVLLNEDNTVYNDNYTDNYKFKFGFIAGNSEFRGQQTIQCYVGTQGGKADDGKTSIGEIKYTKLNKIGELTIYNPIES